MQRVRLNILNIFDFGGFKAFKYVLKIFLALFAVQFSFCGLGYAQENSIEVSSGWSYRWGDASEQEPAGGFLSTPASILNATDWLPASDLKAIPGRNGSKYLWTKVRLPKTKVVNPSLYIHAFDQVAEIFFENQLIYKFGDPGNSGSVKFLGYPWHIIDMPQNYSQSDVYFRIYSSHENIGIISPVSLGNSETQITKMIRNDSSRIVLAIIIICFGLVSLIAFLMLRHDSSYVYFAIAGISIGTWFLTRTSVKQILIDSPVYWMYLEIFSIYLFPIGLGGFFTTVFGYKKLNYITIILAPYAVFSVLLDVFGVLPIMKTLLPFQLFLAVLMFFVIFQSLHKGIKSNFEGRLFAFGIFMQTALGMNDILIETRIISGTTEMARFGTFTLIISLAIILIFRFTEVYKSRQKYALELEKKSADLLSKNATLAEMSVALEKKNADLTRMDKLKDEFLANTSHELRTPLNGIIGIAESMIEGAVGELTPKQAKNLDMIALSGRRLNSLVNDILDFAKLKHKNLNLRKRSLNIKDIIDMVVALSNPLVEVKNLEIINNVPSNIPNISADEDRIHQIFHNIIGNAIKFTEAGKIEISAYVSNFSLIVEISDTGIGIPEDKLDSIFKSFEQVDGSTERQYGGTGLGLTISRQLVELHGGQILVESQLGIGSQFKILLPISEDSKVNNLANVASSRRRALQRVQMAPIVVPEAVLEEDEVVNHRKIKILIVDDEPVNVQVIVNHLTLQNYQTLHAANGEEALKIIESEKPDLMLLDIMMPKMSGYEVCKRVRKSFNASEMPIILLSAKNQVADLAEGFAAGANDYLTKPIVSDELLARIESHINLTRLSQRLEILFNASRFMAIAKERAAVVIEAAGYFIQELQPAEKYYVSAFYHDDSSESEFTKIVFNLTQKDDIKQNERFPRMDQLFTVSEMSQSPVQKSDLDFALGSSLEPVIKEYALSIPLIRENAPFGLICISADSQLTSDINLVPFVKSLAQSLTMSLENLNYFSELVKTEVKINNARFEELGRMAIRLGDKLNNPLGIILNASEEFEELLEEKIVDESLRGEAKHIFELIISSIKKARDELGLLSKFKVFAPSDSLELRPEAKTITPNQ